MLTRCHIIVDNQGAKASITTRGVDTGVKAKTRAYINCVEGTSYAPFSMIECVLSF